MYIVHNCLDGFENSILSFQRSVLETSFGSGQQCFKDGIVWLWHYLIKLNIYSSPFYLSTVQCFCPLLNEREDPLSTGLSTLCYSFGCTC